MKDQLKTIRAGVAEFVDGDGERGLGLILAALAQLEAMVGEQVALAQIEHTVGGSIEHIPLKAAWKLPMGVRFDLYAAPVAQQYEAGDMASAAAQGFRDGVASVAQQPQAASFKEWTSEYVRDNLHKLKRPQAVASQNQPDVRDNAACVSGMRVEQAQAEPDMRKVCEALGFDPTNHHNAAKCPYFRGQQPQAEAVPSDTERLNWIEREYVQVDTFSMPTGAGDADVGWTFKEWYEGEREPRLIYRHYKDDLRAAIDAAIAAAKKEAGHE